MPWKQIFNISKHGGKAVIIYKNCSKIAPNRTIYLKFDYHPGKSRNNHYTAIVEDTGVKPTPAVKEVNSEEPNYEPITPSPTTPTSSPEDYINITDASTILEHEVNLTTKVFEDFIKEKKQRTNLKKCNNGFALAQIQHICTMSYMY